MADKLGLGREVRELKIGQSFTNPKSTAFHTVRYDFKPASVDLSKKATVSVANNHQVTVTVPGLDGPGAPQTVFKGSQRPYQKECVLVIDRVTGQITLEKLSCNIQVKKTRSENPKPSHALPDRLSQLTDKSSSSQNSNTSSTNRSQTPPVGQRISHKTKVTSGSRRPDRPITHLVPKHSPLHASPGYPSPGQVRSPRRDLHSNHSNESHSSQSTLASLPIIGFDEFSDPAPQPSNTHVTNPQFSTPHSNPITTTVTTTEKSPTFHFSDHENGIGEITDSSSSSSDSDSDTDPDNTVIEKTMKHNGLSNGVNGTAGATSKVATRLLNEDLNLSESGSDSD